MRDKAPGLGAWLYRPHRNGPAGSIGSEHGLMSRAALNLHSKDFPIVSRYFFLIPVSFVGALLSEEGQTASL